MEATLAISRRIILQAAGGAGLALVGAGGLFAATRTPARALAAWTNIDNTPPHDVRLDAFRHAILAPNPHNRQPWRIQLVGDDEAIIICDLDRRLPETDPFDRQIVVGFGCFLEIARIAAAQRGVAMEIKPFPDGVPTQRLDLRTIARLRFVKTAAGVNDPLFRPFLIVTLSRSRMISAAPSSNVFLIVCQRTNRPGCRCSRQVTTIWSGNCGRKRGKLGSLNCRRLGLGWKR
jgi:hypothetical protein